MMRQEKVHVSTATIWHALKRNNVSATLRPPKRISSVAPKRYSLDTPGQRVQIDSCKIGKGLWQMTAIDDCTRMRVLGLYSDHQATRSVHFVQERVLKEFPFPIQRIHIHASVNPNRPRQRVHASVNVFMADSFQALLKESKIKFRPNRPRSPHLNGKVERSQQTDRVEFWAGVDLSAPSEELGRQQHEWQAYYNEERMHSALSRKTPHQKWEESKDKVPSAEQIHQAYDPTKEVKRTNSLRSWQLDEPAEPTPKKAVAA